MQSLAEWKFGSCNVGDKKKQEDLLDLITALFKLARQSQRSADSKAALDDSLTGTHGLLFIDYCFRP